MVTDHKGMIFVTLILRQRPWPWSTKINKDNIGQINLSFYSLSSTGQTTKYSIKIFKITFLEPGFEETVSLCSVWRSALYSEQRSSVTSLTEIVRLYFFRKRWKPRICLAEFFDFNIWYLENKNEFFKNVFETVFSASKSSDRSQLVSAFQLTFLRLLFT